MSCRTCRSEDESVYGGKPLRWVGGAVPGHVSMCMHRFHELDDAIERLVQAVREQEQETK